MFVFLFANIINIVNHLYDNNSSELVSFTVEHITLANISGFVLFSMLVSVIVVHGTPKGITKSVIDNAIAE